MQLYQDSVVAYSKYQRMDFKAQEEAGEPPAPPGDAPRRRLAHPTGALFTMTDPSTMTVAQLKEALKTRGLDATGLKAALVARLRAALESSDADAEANDGASVPALPYRT